MTIWHTDPTSSLKSPARVTTIPLYTTRHLERNDEQRLLLTDDRCRRSLGPHREPLRFLQLPLLQRRFLEMGGEEDAYWSRRAVLVPNRARGRLDWMGGVLPPLGSSAAGGVRARVCVPGLACLLFRAAVFVGRRAVFSC